MVVTTVFRHLLVQMDPSYSTIAYPPLHARLNIMYLLLTSVTYVASTVLYGGQPGGSIVHGVSHAFLMSWYSTTRWFLPFALPHIQ